MSLVSSLPILQTGSAFAIPRIESLLIKPASAVCNLDCEYCFYLDRDADPYKALSREGLPSRRMSLDTLERLVESYLAYSYPHSSFIFQGGEPTLAGLPFFEKLVEFQTQYGRSGQVVSNALQTNAVLLDENWCKLFRDYNWFLGVSLDGLESMHDRYRYNKGGAGSWKQVMQSVALLQKHAVPFNILCVVSQANVGHAAELYRFFRSLGVDNLQFIPLAEFDPQGNPLPFTLTAQQYGKFLVDLHQVWQPDRKTMHIRFFENILEALAGKKPTTCTMHQSCDSYAVVEYNGDVYPCDFFVEKPWKLGNIMADSWGQIAARPRRLDFASKKSVPHPVCQACEYQSICHSGCPKLRTAQHRNFEDLDYFCESYKMIFAKFKT
ncbi:MAG TPA: anaerobic sulfatase maturase [Bryobacteraceae bacterium]|jgi:uncharacterized protein